VLLGHSFGGQVAVQAAADYPELMSAVILVAPALNRNDKSIGTRGIETFSSLMHQPLHWLPKSWRFKLLKGFDYTQSSPAQQAILKVILREDMRRLLPQLQQPTLLVWGEKDRQLLGNGKELISHIPHGRLKLMYDVGHHPHTENPRLLYQLVSRFVS
jgi:pimeloyl-ACP methyl ester carboxylesterase